MPRQPWPNVCTIGNDRHQPREVAVDTWNGAQFGVRDVADRELLVLRGKQRSFSAGSTIILALMVFSAATWSPLNPRPGVAPTFPFCHVHSIAGRLFGSRHSRSAFGEKYPTDPTMYVIPQGRVCNAKRFI